MVLVTVILPVFSAITVTGSSMKETTKEMNKTVKRLKTVNIVLLLKIESSLTHVYSEMLICLQMNDRILLFFRI